MNHITDLCNFLDLSPVNFWAVETVRQRLKTAGFRQLDMRDEWVLTPGDKRYVVQNGSAIFAFVVGSGDVASGFNIIAAHSDSPGFRIKPRCEIACEGMVKLNTEVYGGPILYTWFDRPLSIAGRVALRGDDPLRPRMQLLRFDDPLLVIPHLAIHFNRQVNEGNPLSKQRDMLPVMALNCDNPGGMLRRLVAEKAGVDIDDILDYDLSLYTCQKAEVVGLEGELLCSGRIDDLSMVHAGMAALLDTCDKEAAATRVLAVFDNEETGSGTKQGAGSPIFEHILRRVVMAKGGAESDYMRAVAASFMISADNAHGLHPNYVDKYDPDKQPPPRRWPVHQGQCQLQVYDRCRLGRSLPRHLSARRSAVPDLCQSQRRGRRLYAGQHTHLANPSARCRHGRTRVGHAQCVRDRVDRRPHIYYPRLYRVLLT